jgi:hypothetical protein
MEGTYVLQAQAVPPVQVAGYAQQPVPQQLPLVTVQHPVAQHVCVREQYEVVAPTSNIGQVCRLFVCLLNISRICHRFDPVPWSISAAIMKLGDGANSPTRLALEICAASETRLNSSCGGVTAMTVLSSTIRTTSVTRIIINSAVRRLFKDGPELGIRALINAAVAFSLVTPPPPLDLFFKPHSGIARGNSLYAS